MEVGRHWNDLKVVPYVVESIPTLSRSVALLAIRLDSGEGR